MQSENGDQYLAENCACGNSRRECPVFSIFQKGGSYGIRGRCESLRDNAGQKALYEACHPGLTLRKVSVLVQEFTEAGLCPVHVGDAVVDAMGYDLVGFQKEDSDLA